MDSRQADIIENTQAVASEWSLTVCATRLVIELRGAWTLSAQEPDIHALYTLLDAHSAVQSITVNCQSIAAWDSHLIAYLLRLRQIAADYDCDIHFERLPEGSQSLLNLASPATKTKTPKAAPKPMSLLARIGEQGIALFQGTCEVLGFVGDLALSFKNLLKGKARFLGSDLVATMHACGDQALPIVLLINFLVGLILAFISSIQLKQFGAQLYVANLVGVGMVRELAPVMTAIIMAGRTGAAFAAELGTMQVNEEIDAFKTLVIPPMDFLVMPRVLAFILMMPLLLIYADLVSILGGAVVGVGMLKISIPQYIAQTRSALDITNIMLGLLKGSVFGILIAIAGCLRGMQCGRNAAAVGRAATSAVVTSIVWILLADAVFEISFNILGI